MKHDVHKKHNYPKKDKDYKMDDNGWILLSQTYPKKKHWFEVVQIYFEDGWVQTGWWTGQIWDGGHEIHDGKPIKWRFKL